VFDCVEMKVREQSKRCLIKVKRRRIILCIASIIIDEVSE